MTAIRRNPPLAQPRRTTRTTLAAVLTLMLTMFGLTASPAFAVDATVANLDELKRAITAAGTDPSTITIDGTIDGSVQIPAGANITFLGVNNGTLRASGGPAMSIAEGAATTFGNGFTVAGDPNSVRTYEVIIAAGELTMLDGSKVTGARNLVSDSAPIVVEGPNAHFTMRGGEITDNRIANATWQRVAGAALARSGGVIDLVGGTIHDNGMINDSGPIGTSAIRYTTGGVLALPGGTVNHSGTQIYHNTGQAGGGLLAYSLTTGQPAIINISDNAVIAANVSNAGGGVGAYANATVRMTGGSIFNNLATQGGGGVNIMDLCYSADNFGNRVDFQCAARGKTITEWAKDFPAAFIMDGGVIRDNTAQTTGGGLNVSSVSSQLNAGDITGNKAAAQGGGVYVTTQPYSININNSLVTENTASLTGGGVWVCPTGEAHFYITNGTAVTNNTLSAGSVDPSGDDVRGERYGRPFAGKISTSARTLGGGEISWYLDSRDDRYQDGDQAQEPQTYTRDVALHTEVTDEALKLAKSVATVNISGNTAPRGGGIGSNGTVYFGTPETDTLTLTKVWQYSDGNALADTDVPEQATFDLYAVVANQEYHVQQFTAAKTNGWKVTLADLPTEVAGQQPEYVIRETPIAGVTSTIGELIRDADGNWTVTATNEKPAPTPTATPTPEPTPTPTPESTPEPTPEPIPTPSEQTIPSQPQPPQGDLARTGADVGQLGAFASIALVAGAVLLATHRKRQHS